MIKQLFVNAALLVAMLFTINHHFIRKPLSHDSSIKDKLMIGIITGLAGSILVVFGVPISKDIIVDFRYISLIVPAIYCGPLSSITGGLIIAVFRLFHIGISYSSIIAIERFSFFS